MASADRSGYVYVIQADNGLCKIGRAKDVSRRLRALQIGATHLTLIVAWPCEDAVEEEAVQHEFWSEFRVRGEWFAIPPEHVALWKEMPVSFIPRRDDERAWFELIHGPTADELW